MEMFEIRGGDCKSASDFLMSISRRLAHRNGTGVISMRVGTRSPVVLHRASGIVEATVRFLDGVASENSHDAKILLRGGRHT